MERQIKPISGPQIVKRIRRKNRGQVGLYLFIGLFGLMMIAGAVYGLHEGHWFYGLAAVALAAGIFWYCGTVVKKAMETLKNVEHARVFRKYGSPDQLAERISEGRLNTLYVNKQTLVGADYLMRLGDFESFIPFDQVKLMYRKEHRTNGILDSIALVAYDAYGDCFEYPFPLGKKHGDEMDMVVQSVLPHTTDCRLGYNQENLSYVRQNALTLDE